MIAVFGHRGARGLLPENTLAGFALARRLGLTGVEFDVAVTADGVAVVHHDPRLNGDMARDGRGAYVGGDAPLIRDLTYEQLAAYDVGRLRAGSDYAGRFPDQRPQDGARIPALRDVLADSAPLDLLVEIKTFPDRPEATLVPARLVEEVVRVLRETGAVRNAVLFAFDWRVLEAAAMLEPALRRCCLTAPETVKRADLWFGKTRLDLCAPETPGSVARAVASTGSAMWAPFHEMLDAAAMDEARRLGLAVIPWTVNEEADLHRMIDLGVDGIISDWPDRVKQILIRRGIRPAAPGFVAGLHASRT
ncbi:MAG TPA: glycerophosphodiester phosphodiesterase family protein [Acidocella sp.]|nr:glycerophosphodiester phosphodiesterase family protein [Acidocella sp.]